MPAGSEASQEWEVCVNHEPQMCSRHLPPGRLAGSRGVVNCLLPPQQTSVLSQFQSLRQYLAYWWVSLCAYM